MSAFTDAMRKQFPDLKDASDADILAEAKQRTGFRGSQRAFNVSIGATPRTTGAARLAQMFGQGASFGWGDELAGAAAPLMQPLIGALDIATGGAIGSSDEPGLAGAYKSAKLALEGNLAKDVTQIARGELQMAREDAPLASMGAEMAGGLASAVGGGGALGRLGAGIAQTAPNLGRAIQAVGQASTPAARIAGGAMGGSLYGAGAADEGNRMQGAMHGAMLGGLIPPAASGAGKLGLGAAKLATKISPSGHTLRALASLAAPPGMKMWARDMATIGSDALKVAEKAANSPVPGRLAGTMERTLQATPEQKVLDAAKTLGARPSVAEVASATGLSEAETTQALRNIATGGKPPPAQVVAPAAPPVAAPPVAAPPVAAPPVAAPPVAAPPVAAPPVAAPPVASSLLGVTPAAAKPVSLDAFAKIVNDAAKKTPTRYSPRDAFISGVWNDTKGKLGGMSEAQFREKLLEAHRAGKVHLARADLVGAMNPADVAASETKLGDLATFHFVVTPEEAAKKVFKSGVKKGGRRAK